MFSYRQFVEDRKAMDENYSAQIKLERQLQAEKLKALKMELNYLSEQNAIAYDKFKEVLDLAKIHTHCYLIAAPAELNARGEITKPAVQQDEPYLQQHLVRMKKYVERCFKDLYDLKASSIKESPLKACHSFYQNPALHNRLMQTKQSIIDGFPNAETEVKTKVILLLNSIVAVAEKTKTDLLICVEAALNAKSHMRQTYC